MERHLLLEVLPLPFPKSWLLTLEDVAPIIGIAVVLIIIAAIILASIWWYRYWTKKGLKEYEREHSPGTVEVTD